MASILSRAMNSSIKSSISHKYEVYVAAMPLRAPTGPPQLLMSAVYNSLNLLDLQHYVVIVNNSTSLPQSEEFIVWDFQPQDPEDIFTAVAALSGRKIRGIVFTRKLKKLPKRKCWFVGYSEIDAVDKVVEEFNEKWDTDLRIGYHDCRNYANELVEYLTGEKHVLQNLNKQINDVKNS